MSTNLPAVKNSSVPQIFGRASKKLPVITCIKISKKGIADKEIARIVKFLRMAGFEFPQDKPDSREDFSGGLWPVLAQLVKHSPYPIHQDGLVNTPLFQGDKNDHDDHVVFYCRYNPVGLIDKWMHPEVQTIIFDVFALLREASIRSLYDSYSDYIDGFVQPISPYGQVLRIKFGAKLAVDPAPEGRVMNLLAVGGTGSTPLWIELDGVRECVARVQSCNIGVSDFELKRRGEPVRSNPNPVAQLQGATPKH